jgi:2-oxo-3-(phosphooxy)propyl 3-oxoalkanoate synthase
MTAILDMPVINLIPEIDFMHTISRDLTHKRRLENVYVTSTSKLSDTEFAAGAFIPQANVYLNDMRGWRNDVTLTVIEIGRQLGIAICHAHMGVSRANVFVLNTMKMETLPAYHTTDWSVEDMLTARFNVGNQVYRIDGNLSAVQATADFYVSEGLVCRIHSDWSIQPVESGKRLREISRVRNMRNAATWMDSTPPFEGFRICWTIRCGSQAAATPSRQPCRSTWTTCFSSTTRTIMFRAC